MAEVPGFDDVLGMLRTRPGMWKPLASHANEVHIELRCAAMAQAADEADPGEVYEFVYRQTEEAKFTVFGRFDGPGTDAQRAR